ncbi:MAG: class II aldolase/adducin family protein [Candidatus Malihini olakiniferum]
MGRAGLHVEEAHEAQLKKRVFEANMALHQHDLVTDTWGDVSAIDHESGLVVIKLSSVVYEDIQAKDMVVVDLQGNRVEGRYRPPLIHRPTWSFITPQMGHCATHSTHATA